MPPNTAQPALPTAALQAICSVLCDSRFGFTNDDLREAIEASGLQDRSAEERVIRRMLDVLKQAGANQENGGLEQLLHFVAVSVRILATRHRADSAVLRTVQSRLRTVLAGHQVEFPLID